jgi:hypothetical protein
MAYEASRDPCAALVRASLKSQYHAALAMLGDAIARCPDDLWLDARPANAFWQVAYHALYFTHLYLQPNEAAFRPWEGQQTDVQHPDGIAGPPDPASDLPLIPRPYTQGEVLAYCRYCEAMVEDAVDALDLTSAESGFWWYEIPKLEHQLVNIRHLSHHAGQLADRVRAASGEGVAWVRAWPANGE